MRSPPPGFQCLSISPASLNLKYILSLGGQCFRWRHHPSLSTTSLDSYTFALPDRIVQLQQDAEANTVYFRSSLGPQIDSLSTRAWMQDYFNLGVDLLDLYDIWAARDPIFAAVKSAGKFKGIRMLRQEPWEALVGFICSSNNNIKRIELMINRLCEKFSRPLTVPEDWPEDSACHPFPKPEDLAAPGNVDVLRELGFGYRDKFVQSTAAMLLEEHPGPGQAEAWLRELRGQPYEQVIAELLRFLGVGRKVADCIALMSLDQVMAIPVDVHVWQIAVRDYHFLQTAAGKGKSKQTGMTPVLYDAIGEFFRTLHGPYAGWAHSVLFANDLRQFKEVKLEMKEDVEVVEEGYKRTKVESKYKVSVQSDMVPLQALTDISNGSIEPQNSMISKTSDRSARLTRRTLIRQSIKIE